MCFREYSYVWPQHILDLAKKIRNISRCGRPEDAASEYGKLRTADHDTPAGIARMLEAIEMLKLRSQKYQTENALPKQGVANRQAVVALPTAE